MCLPRGEFALITPPWSMQRTGRITRWNRSRLRRSLSEMRDLVIHETRGGADEAYAGGSSPISITWIQGQP
jgi:hypothetical protein